MSKTKPKPEMASSSSKKNEKEGKNPHVCGGINDVMGKGAFSKEVDKFRCVECGKLHDKLPERYLPALKKLSPKRAALLEKGSRNKTTGDEYEKWKKAGQKAWETRRANETKAKKD